MNTEDMDYYEYEEAKKRFTPGKIIKFIFKLIAGVIIVGTFALIFGRSALMKIPKAYTGFTWTKAAVDSYGAGELDVLLHTPYESFDTEGRFHVSDVAISQATGEVQFTVRYNSRSTINELMSRYGLTERPVGEVFVYVLTDNFGNTYTDYVFSAHSNLMYEFRRVIFENVDLDGIYLTEEQLASIDETTAPEDMPVPARDSFTLDIYYGDDVSYNTMMSYNYVLYDYKYGSDIPVFEKVGKTKLTFKDAPYYIARFGEADTEE